MRAFSYTISVSTYRYRTKHEMLLAGLANDMKPNWARLYDEWFSQLADYRMRFATQEELKRKAEFIQGLVDGATAALKKHSN